MKNHDHDRLSAHPNMKFTERCGRFLFFFFFLFLQNVRWAIAGRSVAKLEEVREKLVAIDPSLSVRK